jgi:multiple sugar transport system permease protein
MARARAASRTDRRTAFLLISPAMLVLLAINVFPFIFALYISVHTFTLGRPTPPRFIGLSNYTDLVEDDRFINSLWVSAQFVTLAVVVEFLLGFGAAFLFSARLRGFVTLRKIAMLPIMVMPLASGLIWFYILNENFGALNWFAVALGAPDRIGFLTSDNLALLSIVLADAWQWTPFVMLVMFAALQSIPEYVYEAAKMDGLRGWQIFRRVTLPMLAPAIWVVVVVRMVDAFRMIELVYLMTRGGPGGVTETLSWYIYSTGFLDQDLGYAAAEAVTMIVLVTIVAQVFVRRLEYREAAA